MATKNTNGSKKSTNGKNGTKAPAKNGNGKPAGKAANPNKDPAMKAGNKRVAKATPIVRRDPTPGLARRGSTGTSAPTAAKPGPDPRMPAVGTKIQKLDRRGDVRCECTVKKDGILYAGKTYKSLSAAAVAAAKVLKLGGKTQNGYTFWGLSKPPRNSADVLEALGRAWERYAKVVNGMEDSITADNWEEVHAAIKDHATKIAEMKARADKAADTYKKAA